MTRIAAGRALPLCVLLGAAPPVAAQGLIAVEFDSDILYSIDATTAAKTTIGNTGVSGFASLALAPNGHVYGFTVVGSVLLYRVDPRTAQATPIGGLGINAFEGGLAFDPVTGAGYATNDGSAYTAQLFRIDVTHDAVTRVGLIGSGVADINGLAWRSDGMLVGLDRSSNSLLAIDPATAAAQQIAALPVVVGATGGMTAIQDMGYLGTGGPVSSIPGSNELYSVDLFSGAVTRIGNLGFTGIGLSGLASGLADGSFANYGNGVAGTSGAEPRITGNGLPNIGLGVSIDVHNGVPGGVGCMAFGSLTTDISLFGGTLLVWPQIMIPHTLVNVGGTGGFSLPIAIPRGPGLSGARVYFQALYSDPGAIQGVSWTRGLSMTVGG